MESTRRNQTKSLSLTEVRHRPALVRGHLCKRALARETTPFIEKKCFCNQKKEKPRIQRYHTRTPKRGKRSGHVEIEEPGHHPEKHVGGGRKGTSECAPGKRSKGQIVRKKGRFCGLRDHVSSKSGKTQNEETPPLVKGPAKPGGEARERNGAPLLPTKLDN